MLAQLLKEKGDLTIAALTLNEFKMLLDEYKNETGEMSPPVDDEKLVTLKELSDLTGLSASTIYRMRLSGKIPEYMVNKKPKFNLSEVKKAINVKVTDPSSSSL